VLRRPAGVGKTSLGQSIARAMARKFVRISLGGVRDEAEIRGHRRTYIGSIPGASSRRSNRRAMNPVFMLDEIDKVAAGSRATRPRLLEVLDPAQNHSFRDHYLEVPVDLSKVLFIATAESARHVHPALLDRMEIIQLVAIARRRSCISRGSICYRGRWASMASRQGRWRLPTRPYAGDLRIHARSRRPQSGASVRGDREKSGRKLAIGSPVEPATTVVDRDQVDDYLGPAGSKERWRSGRPGQVWRPVWRGRKPVETYFSSKRPCFQAETRTLF
jgi:hypothetical protein